jgi:hypothetical protein
MGNESLETLLRVQVEKREMWWNYTYAKTLRNLLKLPEALEEIRKTIDYDSEGKQIAIFYRERGLIKFGLGDNSYLNDYDKAINHSESKFRSILENELNNLKAKFGK